MADSAYKDKIVLFNGSNNDAKSKEIYGAWLERHKGTDKVTESRTADMRSALVEYFREEGQIMIATEAGAEGINLQFCALVVNYDLPWNPQRIEQRIGRCHRYGQKHDVIVVNFVNLENETSKSNGEHKFIQDLLSSGKIQSADLSDDEYRVYEQLVSTTPSIDDGEAATIAIAASQHMIPIIDERRGRRQAETLCSGQLPGWSLDLFLHPHVITNLGEADSVDALYLALRDGRMRIHEDHCNHVVGVIGTQRALECNSLPSYKTKRQEWLAS